MSGEEGSDISDYFKENRLTYAEDLAEKKIEQIGGEVEDLTGMAQNQWSQQIEQNRINLALFLERLREKEDMNYSLSSFGNLLTMKGSPDRLVNFTIPQYQRHYSWGKSQLRDFWQEILEVAQADESEMRQRNITEYSTYFGSVYLYDKEDENHEVIDGQQRITTTLVLYRVLIKKLQEIESATEESEENYGELKSDLVGKKDDIREKIYAKNYSDMLEMGQEPSPRIDTNHQHTVYLEDNEEKDFLKELLKLEDSQKKVAKSLKPGEDARESGQIKSKDFLKDMQIDIDEKLPRVVKFNSSNQSLLGAYGFFCRQLDSETEGLKPEKSYNVISNIFEVVDNVFKVGRFELRGKNDTLQMKIFQGLNDRGMELDTVDLINSRVNEAANRWGEQDIVEDWDKIRNLLGKDNEQIEDFLTAYIAAYFNGRISKVDEEGYQQLVRHNVSSNLEHYFMKREYRGDGSQFVISLLQDSHKDNAREFFKRGKEFARYYSELKGIRDTMKSVGSEEQYKRIKSVMRRISDTKQWVPLGLATFFAYEEETYFDANDFERMFLCIENMVFRYKITGENPNLKEKAYAEICFKLNRDLEGDSEDGERLKRDRIEDKFYSAFNDKTQGLFGKGFIEDAAKKMWDSDEDAKNLLKSIFYRMEGDNPGLDSFLNGEMQIEHVLPQTPVVDIERFNENLEGGNKYYWYQKFFSEVDEIDESHPINETKNLIGRLLEKENLETEEKEEAMRKLSEPFIYDLGNLLLLPGKYNNELKNKPFFSKILGYNSWEDLNKTPGSGFFDKREDEFEFTDREKAILSTYEKAEDALIKIEESNSDEEHLLETFREEVRTLPVDGQSLEEINSEGDLESLKRNLEIVLQREASETKSDTWDMELFLERKKKMIEILKIRYLFDKEEEREVNDDKIRLWTAGKARDALNEFKDMELYNQEMRDD